MKKPKNKRKKLSYNEIRNAILKELFSGKWSVVFGDGSSRLISLFYKEGGFDGLYDFVAYNTRYIGQAYHKELIEILQMAKTHLHYDDFRYYIFEAKPIPFYFNNFLKLENSGLLEYYYLFSYAFNGEIECCYKIGNYVVIEAAQKKENKKIFYSKGDYFCVFNTLEQALIYQIYNGKHFETLTTLLNEANATTKGL